MTFTSPYNAAEALLLKTKMKEIDSIERSYLEKIDVGALKLALADDQGKKTFWINIYNAYFQILRRAGNQAPDIYKNKLIPIAGRLFSLDDIEHGILRRFRLKHENSYFEDPSIEGWIREMAVDEVDFRIHFALNCGARSCPPIAFYSLFNIDPQLEMATLSFLNQETDLYFEKKEAHISMLFPWYEADFGGESGMREILERYLQVKLSNWKLVYKEYNWDEELDNFIQEPVDKN
ncbi:MAG: DUF547 domain-containing protein [Bacteroidota bacterium]